MSVLQDLSEEEWIKLRKELKIIYDNFEDGKIVNKISNKALLRKILRRMAQLEEE